MQHLIRAIGLLALFLIAFFTLRPEFRPPSFGQYGFYRGQNVKEWADLPVEYASAPSCQPCHQDRYETWARSKHRTVICENCHGPAETHIEKKAKLIKERSRKLCALCHSQLVSRPRGFPQVDLEKHGDQLACVTCHNPHNPPLAAPPAIPHGLEGLTGCLLCHGAAGVKPFPPNHAGRSNATCLGCHRGKK